MPFTFSGHKNLRYALVKIAPVPPLAGVTFTLQTGFGPEFAAIPLPFYATLAPAGVLPTLQNAEVVKVTNVVGDVQKLHFLLHFESVLKLTKRPGYQQP